MRKSHFGPTFDINPKRIRFDRFHSQIEPALILRERYRSALQRSRPTLVADGLPLWWLSSDNTFANSDETDSGDQRRPLVPVGRIFGSTRRRRNRNSNTGITCAQVFEARCLLTGLVTSIDALIVAETPGKESAELQIQLGERPGSVVIVTIDSRQAADYSVTTETMTFSPDNWNQPKTVNIVANDDVEFEGTETFDLQLTAIERFTRSYATVSVSIGDHENHVRLAGTDTADEFEFTALTETDFEVTLNGQDYLFEADGLQIEFDAAKGIDKVTINGSPGSDQMTVAPDTATATGSGYELVVSDSEKVLLVGEQGDSVAIFDSVGDDTVSISSSVAKLVSDDFTFEATGFSSVQAFAENGGYDVAVLTDSEMDDYFVSKSGASLLTTSASVARVSGFESVSAQSINGGNDHAEFFDAGTDDYFIQTGDRALYRNTVDAQHVSVDATGFSQVTSHVDVPAPYEKSVAGHDRDLLSVGREIANGAPIPANDWRFDYPRSLVEYKADPAIQLAGNHILPQLDDYYLNHANGELHQQVGYHELIPINGSLEDAVVSSTAPTGPQKKTLTDRFGLQSRVTTMNAIGESKGTVVLFHGSYSIAEYLTGEVTLPDGNDEYHRLPAPVWQAAGYDVVVPELQGSTWIELPELGYSFLGLEAARLIDLIDVLSSETDQPIVVVGLSRGATVAEIVGALSPAVDITVSTGGGLRRAPGENSLGNAAFFDAFTDRALVIVAAVGDTYMGWTFEDAKEYAANLEQKFDSDGGSLRVAHFDGYHEMWAEGESDLVSDLLSHSLRQ